MTESVSAGNQIVSNNIKKHDSNILKSSNAMNDDVTRLILSSKKEGDLLQAKEIMNKFDFKGLQFLEAFRTFTSTIDLCGDSQQIIIMGDHFCKRFVECNETDIYNFEQYSGLLLRIFLLSKSFSLKKGISEQISLETFINSFTEPDDIRDKVFLTQIFSSIKKNPILREQAKKRTTEDKDMNSNNIKKPKNEKHYGSGYLSRKVIKSKDGNILDKTLIWKKYFASLDDLSLSLYKATDIRAYMKKNSDRLSKITSMMNDQKFVIFLRSQTPQEVLALDHCLAKPKTSDDQKFILYLNDGSQYCFRVSDSTYVEYWNSTINYTAALLSKPRLLATDVDVLCYSRLHFMGGLTSFDMVDQLAYLYQQCSELKRQKEHIENLTVKFDHYKSRLKEANFTIERFETYIRHLKITLQEQQQHQPKCDIDELNGESEIDSLDTYGSVCGVSNDSSTTAYIVETKSKMPSIGSPIGDRNQREKSISD